MSCWRRLAARSLGKGKDQISALFIREHGAASLHEYCAGRSSPFADSFNDGSRHSWNQSAGHVFQANDRFVSLKILSVACESRPEYHLAVSPNNSALKTFPAEVFCFNLR
jgi:hypothetical protein